MDKNMAKNPRLEELALTEFNNFLQESDPAFKIISEGDAETGKCVIQALARVRVDEKYKLRMHYQNFIFYGYDFSQKDENGIPARQIYERGVTNTKKLGGRPGFETFIKDGVVGDEFGWYLTKMGD